MDEAKQWAIGDWLLDGKRHYGDGLYKRAAEVTGQSARTLEDYKRMADAFEITLRNVGLTYNHHKEVASIKTIATADGKLYLSDEPDQAKVAELLGEAAELWIIRNQLARRNLHEIDRIALERREEELMRLKAKENRVAAGKATGRGNKKVSAKLPTPLHTRREAALAAGVGERTYDAGKLVLDAA